MTSYWRQYLNYLLHPFQIQKAYYLNRTEAKDFASLQTYQIMAMAWIFVTLTAILEIFFFHSTPIVITLFKKFGSLNLVNESFIFNWGKGQIVYFLVLGFEVIIFPVSIWLMGQLWKVNFRFCGIIFDWENKDEEVYNQVIYSSFTNVAFRLIPLLGDVLFYFLHLNHLYAGLRENIRASKYQAVVTIFLPLMILSLLFFIVSLFIILMIKKISYLIF